MPSRDEPRKVVALAGIVGTEPETRETPNGDPVTNFRLAVTTSYEEDAESKWFDVAVWNEGLIDSVEAEIYKGAKVAVEGTLSSREYAGTTYLKINAAKVGLIEWLARSKGNSQSRRPARDEEEERPARRAPARSSSRSSGTSTRSRASRDDAEDDLPW